MPAADLLALYDRHERREARPPGLTVEVTPRVVRHIGPPGHPSWVLYADLGEGDADDVIRGEQAHFAALGRGFEWKHFAHDRPADLAARLVAAGFVAEVPEVLMALDLASLPAWMFGGGSLPEHRGRGHYRALVGARVHYALAQGARALTVDAGPMSAPILGRLGFERLTTTTPFVWQPAASR